MAELAIKLPTRYYAYANIFSKGASNKLLLYREGINIEIKLEEGASIQDIVRYSPLMH